MKLLICIISIVLFISCNSRNEECREENTYEVVPEVGIGPYRLGMLEADFLKVLCDKYTKRTNGSWFSKATKKYYFIKNMTFVIEKGHLCEIVAWGSFRGTYRGLTLNYRRKDLMRFGKTIEYDQEYRIIGISKIAFGIEYTEEEPYFKIYE